jgi:8-oxo-dGTP pyrophosphatase MutT (NUDIX family)
MTQMYKVFINNKCIFLSNDKDDFSGRTGKVYNYTNEPELFATIDEFEKNKSVENLFVVGSPQKILALFPQIEAAGGLVKKTDGQILFIFRYGRWDLPKGKMEINETPRETALREVTEETGVTGLEITKELCSTYHTYRLNGQRVLKKTHWFEMSFTDDSHILPQAVEDITVVKWLNKKDIPWVMIDSYASIIELLTNSGYL